MIYVLESVPGLADIGVPHGDGPSTPPRCLHQRPDILVLKPPPLYWQADQEWTRILLLILTSFLLCVEASLQCAAKVNVGKGF